MKKSYSILLLIFLTTPFFTVYAQTPAFPKPCAPGYIQGNVPTTQVPDYDYTSDGFLEFHFRLTNPTWKYNFGQEKIYDQNCNLIVGGTGIFYDRKASAWPGVSHLILRYVDDIYPGYPHFNAFNGDTGALIPLDTSTILGDLSGDNIGFLPSPSIRLIFGNRSSTNFDWNTETGDLISTPALQLKILPSKIPVLVVPGVLGTDINKGSEKLWLDLQHNFTDKGDQFMDPLQFNASLTSLDTSLAIGEVIREAMMIPSTLVNFNYTKGLIDLFTSQGYTEGTNSDANLFTFPYDWRYGVSGTFGNGNTNVDLLQQKIQDIMTQTGSNKVDVIAHSTGGLLVKKYVMDHSTDNHIGKAVFVGVPNTGAPKAIKVLLKGDSFGIPWLADEEMQKLSKNFPVVYDLSPSQQYFNTKGSYVKIIDQNLFSSSVQDLDFSQINSFLTTDHGLNNQALNNTQNLHTINFDNFDMRNSGVDLYSISGCRAGTISKVIERRDKDIFGNTNITYDQPQLSPGDGTVPLESATNLPINQDHKYFALKADHGKMPSQDGIRQEIVNLITGSNLSFSSNLITQDVSQCKLKGKAISIFSPLDIDITDQDGNHSGLVSGAIQNDIPNADFQIMDEHKFIYLPDDEGQVYSVKINGTGDGTFTLREDEVDNNKIQQTQVFSDIPVTTGLVGQVNLGATTTLSLDNNGDGTIDQTIQPSLIINDTTPPEFSVQFNPATKDLQFIGTDDISGPEDITVVDNDTVITLSDRAGNSLQMTLKDRNRRLAMVAEMQSLSYNNQIVDVSPNSLKFSWSYDKSGQLSSLKQIVKSRSNFSISATYNGSSTQITGQDQTGKISKTLNGLVLLKVLTKMGDLSWSY